MTASTAPRAGRRAVANDWPLGELRDPATASTARLARAHERIRWLRERAALFPYRERSEYLEMLALGWQQALELEQLDGRKSPKRLELSWQQLEEHIQRIGRSMGARRRKACDTGSHGSRRRLRAR